MNKTSRLLANFFMRYIMVNIHCIFEIPIFSSHLFQYERHPPRPSYVRAPPSYVRGGGRMYEPPSLVRTGGVGYAHTGGSGLRVLDEFYQTYK